MDSQSDNVQAFARAVEMVHSGRLAEAAAVLEQLVRSDPLHHEAFQYLAVVGLNSGNAAAAREAIERAIVLRPDLIAYRMFRAAVLHMTGAFGEARAELALVLASAPGNVEALNNAGVVERDDGRLAEAESLFRRALDLQPDFTDAMFNLAKLKAQAGLTDEAGRWLEQARVLRPQDPRFHVPVRSLAASRAAVAAPPPPVAAVEPTKTDPAYRALAELLRAGSVVPVPDVKILGAPSSPLHRGTDTNQLFAAFAVPAVIGFWQLPLWGGLATAIGLLVLYELAVPRFVARKLVGRIVRSDVAANPFEWERIWGTGGLGLLVVASGRRIRGPAESWRAALGGE